jgi:hypothetical protein
MWGKEHAKSDCCESEIGKSVNASKHIRIESRRYVTDRLTDDACL